jgi:hypothetical protein
MVCGGLATDAHQVVDNGHQDLEGEETRKPRRAMDV